MAGERAAGGKLGDKRVLGMNAVANPEPALSVVAARRDVLPSQQYVALSNLPWPFR